MAFLSSEKLKTSSHLILLTEFSSLLPRFSVTFVSSNTLTRFANSVQTVFSGLAVEGHT